MSEKNSVSSGGTIFRAPKLKPGDRVRLVSPASTPERNGVRHCVEIFKSWGLKVELGAHIYDRYGYLAGTDEDRLADINDALRDPGVRAIIATRGGKGAYRIADQLDFKAARKDPKPLVGFSENTSLHLALLKYCHIPGIHGAISSWNVDSLDEEVTEALRHLLMTTEPVTLRSDLTINTAILSTKGTARGRLVGGNQDMVATTAGWALPSLDGVILLLEAIGMRLGHIDRQLTMLQNAGHLKGLKGIALGCYLNCDPDATTQGNWTAMDVLRDRLQRLNVPILGGLRLGHQIGAVSVPVGTMAVLDVAKGTLIVESGVA
jgi:muramoyltetrapeptide carboxypeptidase